MIFAIAVVTVAIAATNANTMERLLAKHSPHTSYGVNKICQAVEEDSYKRYEPEYDEVEQIQQSGRSSYFGGLQTSRRSRQQVQRCCNKVSQYEKKECLKQVRENFLDNHCDKGVNDVCCKIEGTSRYTCFSKNPSGRLSPFQQQQPRFNDEEQDSFQSFQTQQERRRRYNQQEQQEELLDEIELQQQDEEQVRGFSNLEQGQDLESGLENQLYRQTGRQARQAVRQALSVEQEVEQEARELARTLRLAQHQQKRSLVQSQLNSQESKLKFEFEPEFERESIMEQQVLRQLEQYGDDTEEELVQGIAQQSYQQQKRRAARDAQRVAREIKQQGGNRYEAEQVAQQVYQQEKEQVKRQAIRQAERLVEQIQRQEGSQYGRFENVESEILFNTLEQQEESRLPYSQSNTCPGKLEQITKVAAKHACRKNAQRNGQQTSKTCCESGAIVGQTVGQQNHQVCVPALLKFQYKTQGCGVNHKPQCKHSFVQCCKQEAQQARRQMDNQEIDMEEVFEQSARNQYVNQY